MSIKSFTGSACVVVLAACGGPRVSGSTIRGERADVHTADGAYPGYRVSRACHRFDCIGIQGTGAQWYPGMERERINEDARFRAAFEHYRSDALQAAAGITIDTTSLGDGCTEFGLVVGVTDWHLVDPLIAKLGELLHARDLREQITVCAQGPLTNIGADHGG